MKVFRAIVAAFFLGACSIAIAQPATLAEVRSKNGVRLSASQVRELMPGAKVVSRTPAGSTRHWENKPDGTFSASTDGSTLEIGRSRADQRVAPRAFLDT
jgi:hypothetical protein